MMMRFRVLARFSPVLAPVLASSLVPLLGPTQALADPPPVDPLALQYAPLLRFDQAATSFPISAQDYLDQVIVPGKQQQAASLTRKSKPGTGPTYYQITRCGRQVRIQYFWFYAQKLPCVGNSGGHDGDWQRLLVTLSEDESRIAALTYFQQGGHYTLYAAVAPLPLSGSHPIVRVGKLAHGSYHDGTLGYGGCGYWADFRNPGQSPSTAKELSTWQRPLLLLSTDPAKAKEPWMLPTAQSTTKLAFQNTIDPLQSFASCEMPACSGAAVALAGNSGCFLGQCPIGSHESIKGTCQQNCRPGYTDTGLTCHRPVPAHSYAPQRKTIRYPLPQTDQGLLTM